MEYNVGDKVFHAVTGLEGEIKTVYPEVNTVLIETMEGLEKARFENLRKVHSRVSNVSSNVSEEAEKKDGLLDRIKGKFR